MTASRAMVLLAAAAACLLGSCNTMAGLGKDLKKAGKAVTTPDPPAEPSYDGYYYDEGYE